MADNLPSVIVNLFEGVRWDVKFTAIGLIGSLFGPLALLAVDVEVNSRFLFQPGCRRSSFIREKLKLSKVVGDVGLGFERIHFLCPAKCIRSVEIASLSFEFELSPSKSFRTGVDILPQKLLQKQFVLISHLLRKLFFFQMNFHVSQPFNDPLDAFRVIVEVFNSLFEQFDDLVLQHFVLFLYLAPLLFQLLLFLQVSLVSQFVLVEFVLHNLLLLIDCTFLLVESPPPLQLKTKIQLLIEFDPRQHGISHLQVLTVDVFNHVIFAFLLSEFVRSLVYLLLLMVKIVLQLQKLFLVLIQLQLQPVHHLLLLDSLLPQRTEHAGQVRDLLLLNLILPARCLQYPLQFSLVLHLIDLLLHRQQLLALIDGQRFLFELRPQPKIRFLRQYELRLYLSYSRILPISFKRIVTINNLRDVLLIQNPFADLRFHLRPLLPQSFLDGQHLLLSTQNLNELIILRRVFGHGKFQYQFIANDQLFVNIIFNQLRTKVQSRSQHHQYLLIINSIVTRIC